jgi:hypothetical protein
VTPGIRHAEARIASHSVTRGTDAGTLIPGEAVVGNVDSGERPSSGPVPG